MSTITEDHEITTKEKEIIQMETAHYYEDVDDMEDPNEFTESDLPGSLGTDTIDDDATIEKNQLPGSTDGEQTKSNEPRLISLPLSKIKSLMKLDPDMIMASSEAVFAITKATELFIDSMAKESFLHTAQAKKRTIQKKDIDKAIESVDSLMFLEGAMNF